MRKQHDFWVIRFGLQINWQSFWTNRAQVVKKNQLHKSCLHNLLSNGFSVLLTNEKSAMVFTDILYCTVHHYSGFTSAGLYMGSVLLGSRAT
jgi:hypothetical protein